MVSWVAVWLDGEWSSEFYLLLWAELDLMSCRHLGIFFVLVLAGATLLFLVMS